MHRPGSMAKIAVQLLQAKYAAIRYTEPFLNNQHIVEPTLFYLKHLAKATRGDKEPIRWLDIERNTMQ